MMDQEKLRGLINALEDVLEFLVCLEDSKKTRKIVVNVCYGGFGLSKECHDELVRRGHDFSKSFTAWGRDIARDDPKLIEVIEKLGVEACSGEHAKLAITEIPKNVKWWLHEYDGTEYVE